MRRYDRHTGARVSSVAEYLTIRTGEKLLCAWGDSALNGRDLCVVRCVDGPAVGLCGSLVDRRL